MHVAADSEKKKNQSVFAGSPIMFELGNVSL